MFNDPTNEPALQEHFSNGIPLCGKNKFDTDKSMDCILNIKVEKKYFQEELFTYDFRKNFRAKIFCPILVMYGDKNSIHSKENALETIAALPSKWVRTEYFKYSETPVYDNEPERAKNSIQEFFDNAYQSTTAKKNYQ